MNIIRIPSGGGIKGLAVVHVNLSFRYGAYIDCDANGSRESISFMNQSSSSKDFGFCTVNVNRNSDGATIDLTINTTGTYIIQGNISVSGKNTANIDESKQKINAGTTFSMSYANYNASGGLVVVWIS